jgi:preprotein translocase SecE subunit
VNRQTKRQMARSGMDAPRPASERRSAVTATVQRERTTPAQYLREVQGEMKKVAWPPRAEVQNSTAIVLVAVVVMTGLIFGADWLSVHLVDFLFR